MLFTLTNLYSRNMLSVPAAAHAPSPIEAITTLPTAIAPSASYLLIFQVTLPIFPSEPLTTPLQNPQTTVFFRLYAL